MELFKLKKWDTDYFDDLMNDKEGFKKCLLDEPLI